MSENSNFGYLIPNRIFVGGIDPQTTLSELKSFFAKFGEIKYCNLFDDKKGSTKKYGFITFANVEEAENLINFPQDLILNGRKLNIGPAIKRKTIEEIITTNISLLQSNESFYESNPLLLQKDSVSLTPNNQASFIPAVYPSSAYVMPSLLPINASMFQPIFGDRADYMNPLLASDSCIFPSYSFIPSNFQQQLSIPLLQPLTFIPSLESFKQQTLPLCCFDAPSTIIKTDSDLHHRLMTQKRTLQCAQLHNENYIEIPPLKITKLSDLI